MFGTRYGRSDTSIQSPFGSQKKLKKKRKQSLGSSGACKKRLPHSVKGAIILATFGRRRRKPEKTNVR